MEGHKTKESEKKKKKKEKNPPAISTPSCPRRGAAPFPTKPRIPSTNTRTGCKRSKSRTFTEQTEFFVVAVPGFIFSVLLTLPSLFSFPYSYPLHFPSFSCATIPVAKKHMKKCSPFLAIKEMQIKTTLRFHPHPC
jgi:hypothetical protein